MLHQLTYDQMKSHVDAEFRVLEGEEVRVKLVLTEVRDLATPATMPPGEGHRAPFSLLFRAPMEFLISQQILPMENDALGRLDIFVVPVAQDDEGTYYEAVFN